MYEFRGDVLTVDNEGGQYAAYMFRFDADHRTLVANSGRRLRKSNDSFVNNAEDRLYHYAVQDGRLLLAFSKFSTQHRPVACDPLKPATGCIVLVFTRDYSRN